VREGKTKENETKREGEGHIHREMMGLEGGFS